MTVKSSEYLASLIERSNCISRQFITEPVNETKEGEAIDPLDEETFEVVPRLIHKYKNRVLCILTTECAAYCSFCTRKRIVGEGRALETSKSQIDGWIDYLRETPNVSEAILSGGDAFVASDETFLYAFDSIASLEQIKVMRIGTRTVVSDPSRIAETKLSAISKAKQPIYVGINFEHPDEITAESEEAILKLRRSGAILYSQTVFLKGINDDFNTLKSLFTKLVECGVRPYYIYRCDPVAGLSRFRVDFQKEREIMTRLRSELSGLACPTYVIDTPYGSGKIPVPLDFWELDCFSYKDFEGEIHEII